MTGQSMQEGTGGDFWGGEQLCGKVAGGSMHMGVGQESWKADGPESRARTQGW
jgi:hypothetical protein